MNSHFGSWDVLDSREAACGAGGRLCAYAGRAVGRRAGRVGAAVALVALMCGVPGCATDTGGRAAGTARAGVRPGFVPPEHLWRVSLADRSFFAKAYALEQSRPHVAQGGHTLYVGSSAGDLVALRTLDGAEIWRTAIGGGIFAAPVEHGDSLLVGSDDGSLSRLRAASGELVWRYRVKEVVRSSPIVHGGRVYFSSDNDTVHALDYGDGGWQWEYHREPPDDFTIAGTAAPVIVGDVVVAGFADGTVVGLHRNDGALLWSLRLGGALQFPDVDALLPAPGGKVWAASVAGGLFLVDPKGGSVEAETRGLRGIVSLAEIDGDLLAGTGDGQLLRVGPDGRTVRWRRGFGGGTLSGVRRAGESLVASSAALGLLFLDPASGSLLARMDPGGGAGAPAAVDGGRLFFLSNGGYLYGMRLR